MARGAVEIEGLRELVQATRLASREMGRDVQKAIERAGEPIRRDAESRVFSEISGMQRSRIPWWQIRTGIERSTIGYIVPAQRGVTGRGRERRRRRNLAPLIARQEQAALAANRDRVEDEFNRALTDVARKWERAA